MHYYRNGHHVSSDRLDGLVLLFLEFFFFQVQILSLVVYGSSEFEPVRTGSGKYNIHRTENRTAHRTGRTRTI